MDVVAGPFWYEGPDFQKKHEIRPPQGLRSQRLLRQLPHLHRRFQRRRLAGRALRAAFPASEAYWYENPAGKDGPWKKHLALKNVGNESPMWADINGDGRPELVYNINGYLGYATYDPAKPDEPWVFHPITPKGELPAATRTASAAATSTATAAWTSWRAGGWWEQPANAKPGEPWIWHPFQFADAGRADARLRRGRRRPERRDHRLALPPVRPGLVQAGPQRQGRDHLEAERDPAAQARPEVQRPADQPDARPGPGGHERRRAEGHPHRQAVLGPRAQRATSSPTPRPCVYWFELRRDKEKGVQFIPHKIDDDSGVGTQVTAVDLNGDGIPDVIVGNKKGMFLFLSQK